MSEKNKEIVEEGNQEKEEKEKRKGKEVESLPHPSIPSRKDKEK